MPLTHRMSTLAQARWLRWVLVAALALLYTGWLTYVIVADRPLDFYVYYMASELIVRGQSPYTVSDLAWDNLASDLGITNYTRPYRYPPHTAVFLIPFHPLGPRGTMVVWVIANAAAMIGGAWLLGWSLGDDRLPLSLAALLLSVSPLATLLAGQVNGLLFFCLALALWGLANRQDKWIGIGLALGTALKVIPLALVLYLFWRRRWRAGLIAIGVLLVLTLACLPAVGWRGLVEYGHNAVSLSAPGGVHATPSNQTITGVLGRVIPTRPDLALSIGRGLGLLLILATVVLCWSTGDDIQLMVLEFGLITVALQLIPPFTWYHQLVLLLIPLLIVVDRLWAARRWVGLSLLAALFALSSLHGLVWHQIERWPWLTSFPFILMLTLWAISGWFLLKSKWHVAS